MSVGLNPSKNDIDQVAGSIARDFFNLFRRTSNLKYFLDGKTDADLTALGYSPGDIASLRSAAAALDNMRQVWEGGRALATPEDQRTFPRRICGMGDV
jgi:hypothetical protein